MLTVLALACSLGLPVARDTVPPAPPAPILVRRLPPFGVAASPLGERADTPTARPHVAVEHSDAYYTRLTVHRWASYAMIPVFVGQYLAGRQLMEKSADAPAWARNGHRALATATLGLFAVNTVTGAMNWWESRSDPDGRTLRTVHAGSMLLADLGFSAVGLMANAAQNDGNLRRLHEKVAIGSMGLSVASWLIMLPVFHGD